jgi:hypothetical protein
MGLGGGINKQKGIKALAWISFILAVTGGAAVAGTFLGDWVSGLIGFFPGWIGVVILAGAFTAMAIDLFVDGIPNQVALYTAMALPSVARAVPGSSATPSPTCPGSSSAPSTGPSACGWGRRRRSGWRSPAWSCRC